MRTTVTARNMRVVPGHRIYLDVSVYIFMFAQAPARKHERKGDSLCPGSRLSQGRREQEHGAPFTHSPSRACQRTGLLSHTLPQGAANPAGQSQVLSGPTDSAARPKHATRIWGTCRRSHRAVYMHLDISMHVHLDISMYMHLDMHLDISMHVCHAGSGRRPCVACRACDERGFRKSVGLSG